MENERLRAIMAAVLKGLDQQIRRPVEIRLERSRLTASASD